METILTIHSAVAYGHVGNSAAVFPLQRLGAEVWRIDTVRYSNHPGHGGFFGTVTPAAEIDGLVEGIAARGVLGGCDGVLSGFLGDAANGRAIADAVARVRRANPAALYACDPVIGDDGRAYVRPGVAEAIAERLLPLADLLVPNQFELERLAGGAVATLAEAKAAVGRVQAAMHEGPRAVVVTSLRLDDTPDAAIDLLAAEGGGVYRLRTPRLPIAANGAGDAFAALLLLHRLREGNIVGALERAAASVHGVLACTVEAGRRELMLVAAQDELIAPARRFTAVPV